MSVVNICEQIKKGEIIELSSIESIEGFIIEMFRTIDSKELNKAVKECERPYDEGWSCKNIPYARIDYLNGSQAAVTVGFYFESKMTPEKCKYEMEKAPLNERNEKSVMTGCGYYVPMVCRDVNLEKFINENDDIFYFDHYNRKKTIYNGIFFKNEAQRARFEPENSIIFLFR